MLELSLRTCLINFNTTLSFESVCKACKETVDEVMSVNNVLLCTVCFAAGAAAAYFFFRGNKKEEIKALNMEIEALKTEMTALKREHREQCSLLNERIQFLEMQLDKRI